MAFCQISTGDILRQAVAEQTALGKEASQYINRGALVPDSVIVDLVATRLQEKDCEKGFILDGFPERFPRRRVWTRFLSRGESDLNCVLSVQVPQDVIIERLAGRRTCRSCGALQPCDSQSVEKAGICDRCGGELYQRDDDREETIAHRLKVYDDQTAPLLNYYRGARLAEKSAGSAPSMKFARG